MSAADLKRLVDLNNALLSDTLWSTIKGRKQRLLNGESVTKGTPVVGQDLSFKHAPICLGEATETPMWRFQGPTVMSEAERADHQAADRAEIDTPRKISLNLGH